MDLKIISLFAKDYAASFSIREMTRRLKINYPNAFKRVKMLVKQGILTEKKFGKANSITFNVANLEAIQILSYVEEAESKNLKNPILTDLAKEAILIDAFACIGIFGSRVSGKAKKDSDWDVFIITSQLKQMGKLMSRFPYARNIQLQAFSLEEFEKSLRSEEETVVKHIVRNKQIIYNPHVFYNIILRWEKVRYAPRQ